MKKYKLIMCLILCFLSLSSCKGGKKNAAEGASADATTSMETAVSDAIEETEDSVQNTVSEAAVFDTSVKYSLGSKTRVEKVNGYVGEKEITSKDPHYGWDLGNFFVSGYTTDTKDSNGNPVFLKNVGDKVTLWFNLKYDIDCLNEDDALSIERDVDGFDQYFETKRTDFGKGALIIRYTDHENKKSEPQIYTNYLAAKAKTGADTEVQMFEEGDYEVALDYKVKYDKRKVLGKSVLPEYSQYRIFFKFSVRNGNCMVYPFDTVTGSELTNSSITPNGFYLDLAKSRYLKINIKKEVLKEGADGLVEDTRFNRPAKDGEKYTDEGIYLITVKNLYTDQETTKKIYVGTNNILIAHVVTGLSVEEIKEQINQGATILEDGTIVPPEESEDSNATEDSNADTEEESEEKDEKDNKAKNFFESIFPH